MSKKAYWFKFEPSEWLMGKIMRCSEITQARYMRLCCMYWKNECIMSIEDAQIEIDAEPYSELLQKKIIKESGEYIKIKFLDTCMDDIGVIVEKKRNAANARWGKSKGSLKQGTPMQTDADAMHVHDSAMQNDADNITVHNSTEDNNPLPAKPSLARGEILLKKSGKVAKWNDCKKFYLEKLNEVRKEFRPNSKGFEKLSSIAESKLRARLVNDNYDSSDLIHCMKVAFNNEFHAESNYNYLTAEYFTRERTIEMLIHQEVKQKAKFVSIMNQPTGG
jgi:hypothetical protein